MSTPATRTLEAVLRNALQPVDQLRMVVGEYATTPAPDSRYANVIVGGQALTLPNLNAAPAGAAGAPAYILADNTHMWVLGTVTG